jgi:inorganic pyrophosphatase
VDAIALHDSTTYPGVILPCKPIGMIEIAEKKNGNVRSNNRIVAMPTWNDKLGEFEQITELPERLKEELEKFFLSTASSPAKS